MKALQIFDMEQDYGSKLQFLFTRPGSSGVEQRTRNA